MFHETIICSVSSVYLSNKCTLLTKKFQTQNIRMTRITPGYVVIFVRTCMILLIFKVGKKMRILKKCIL